MKRNLNCYASHFSKIQENSGNYTLPYEFSVKSTFDFAVKVSTKAYYHHDVIIIIVQLPFFQDIRMTDESYLSTSQLAIVLSE